MFKSVVLSALATTHAKDAFLFLGATGDNALRPNGVWEGVYEAFAGGAFDKVGGVEIVVVSNTPHSYPAIKNSTLGLLEPYYQTLKSTPDWKCGAASGDCSPDAMWALTKVNVHDGRDACAQAANLKAYLADFKRLVMYLSIPPYAYGGWATCAAQNWGAERLHVAAEKPFGTSPADALALHTTLTKAGLPEDNIHLVDHWLSFFMNKHFREFRTFLEPMLGVTFDDRHFEKVVVTEYEVRGLNGRGSFFDGVGQTRDMIQSHLLQVMALALSDYSVDQPLPAAKLDLFKNTVVDNCRDGQYVDFLLEPKLGYHGTYADATFTNMQVKVNGGKWDNTEVHIATGKDMGELKYTVEMYQRGGPGVLTFENGVEETGNGGIKVSNWPLKDASPFTAPVGGFIPAVTIFRPQVNRTGTGYIIQYNNSLSYYPKPYGVMASNLITADYVTSFVTWDECKESWSIVNTTTGASTCLDPTPASTRIYGPRGQPNSPSPCDELDGPEHVCWSKDTVATLYDVTFACNPANDKKYAGIDFYQAKCH